MYLDIILNAHQRECYRSILSCWMEVIWEYAGPCGMTPLIRQPTSQVYVFSWAKLKDVCLMVQCHNSFRSEPPVRAACACMCDLFASVHDGVKMRWHQVVLQLSSVNMSRY
jgi:hypothetical protein